MKKTKGKSSAGQNISNARFKNTGKTANATKTQGQLVPSWLILPLWCVALALPNLIYSGVKFADTLHILKWTVAGVPVALAALVAGWRLFKTGQRGMPELKLDLFGMLWTLLLALCLIQTFWEQPSSITGYAHEIACFVAVWAFYILTVSSFPDGGLRPLLWLANINAAINVLFAELQIRNMNDLSFLQGTWLEPLQSLKSLILPTPYNYIGNTAQQNMFGLWMAICVMSSVYLFIAYAVRKDGTKRPTWVTVANLLLMAVNVWGLWNSTSRSAILSLIASLFVLGLVTIARFGRVFIKRMSLVLLLFALVLGGTTLLGTQGGGLISKMGDMIVNAGTVGGRIGIWTTSKSMFLEHPMGVTVGQFKWHYLEGQRAGFARLPDSEWYTWQYTHWAHNEFLQWFCETGIFGGILLLMMYGVWFGGVLSRLFGSKVSRWVMPALAICILLILDFSLFSGLSMLLRVGADIFTAAGFALLLGMAQRGMLASHDFIASNIANTTTSISSTSTTSTDSTSQEPSLSPAAIWGCALVVLISFSALWTRPFHRIENILWLTLAFALTNREFLTNRLGLRMSFTKGFTKLVGVAFMVGSIAGIIYLGSGIEGNYLLRKALSTQSAEPQRRYLEQAMKHPITYEDSLRNLGYHYLQLGEQSNNVEMIGKGFELIWEHFKHEPHSEDLSSLMTWAQKFQVEPLIAELYSYMKPGSYKLVRQKVHDSNGNEMDALVIQSN